MERSVLNRYFRKAAQLINDKCFASKLLHTSHYFLIRKWIFVANCGKSSSRKKKKRDVYVCSVSNVFTEPHALSVGWLPVATLGLREAGPGFL